jgi:hypothetical protein
MTMRKLGNIEVHKLSTVKSGNRDINISRHCMIWGRGGYAALDDDDDYDDSADDGDGKMIVS